MSVVVIDVRRAIRAPGIRDELLIDAIIRGDQDIGIFLAEQEPGAGEHEDMAEVAPLVDPARAIGRMSVGADEDVAVADQPRERGYLVLEGLEFRLVLEPVVHAVQRQQALRFARPVPGKERVGAVDSSGVTAQAASAMSVGRAPGRNSVERHVHRGEVVGQPGFPDLGYAPGVPDRLLRALAFDPQVPAGPHRNGQKYQAAKSFRTWLMRSTPSIHTWITSSGLTSRIDCGDLCTLTRMNSVGAGISRA